MTFKSQPLYGVQVVKEAKSFEEGVENLVYGMIEESEQEELRSLDDMGVEVQVKACCINYPDLMQTTGSYQHKRTFPYVPGLECAGIVSKVTVPEEICYKVPEQYSFEEAAACLMGFTTAYHGLFERAQMKTTQLKGDTEAEWVLINGATGGMGLAAALLASYHGANIIVTGGNDDKLAVVKQLTNAALTVNYNSTPEFSKVIKQFQACKEGVDIVFDTVGGSTLREGLKSTRYGGRVLIVGFTSKLIPDIAANYILIKQLSILGCRAGETLKRSRDREQLREKRMRDLLNWMNTESPLHGTCLRPYISHTYHFSQDGVRKAFQALKQRKVIGRACVSMGSAADGSRFTGKEAHRQEPRAPQNKL